MSEVIQFALLGLGLGAVYALASQGLLIVYRGSGVLNFAQGALGMSAAFINYSLTANSGVPYLLAALIGTLAAAALGAATHLLLMRNLKRASPLARTAATLGVLIILQSTAILIYGSYTIVVSSWLPTSIVNFGGSVTVPADQLILVGIAAILTAALWAFYRYSKFGISTTAGAENQRASASLGLSPDRIATINWALGCAVSGIAAILITPIIQLQAATMTNLVLAAMAVALLANFVSFPVAFGGGLLVGVLQSEMTRYVTTPGLAQSAPFVVIVLVMVVRGRGLPLRDFFLQRLPAVGSGRIRIPYVLLGIAITAALILITSAAWQQAFATQFGVALILLSIVVVTGYTGQISLGQYAFAGVGAYIAGRLSATTSVPFVPILLVAVLAAIPVGIIFGLPALRTRGVNLAIVTLGLGSAMELIVFDNASLTGGFQGTVAKPPTLFGLNINPITEPQRYALFALGLFVVVAIVVANIRRGRSGRRMLAVRTNERAATALGVNVVTTKLYAFGVSAAIAALGGIVLAFGSPTIVYSGFTSFTSITDLAYAVIGGVGFILGPVFGAGFAPGALGAQIGDTWFTQFVQYLPLIAGANLVLIVLQNQDGIAKQTVSQLAFLSRAVRKRLHTNSSPSAVRASARSTASKPGPPQKVRPLSLEADRLTVAYGPVVAVQDVSFSIEPGKVLGLIGPNGAGKTSVIDAVTGFTPLRSGRLVLGGVDISSQRATRRARSGISRSFQSLELFEDMTVLDNLRTAADPQDTRSFLRDMILPTMPPLAAEVLAAISEFGLENDLDRTVEDLPYGLRRLLAIARSVASNPSVLLLDEPAAGLGDRESAELAALVRRLADDWGMAVLLVEHDMNFVMSICDELVVMEFGKVIAAGERDAIRHDPKVIAAYLGEDDGALETEAAGTASAGLGGE